ncbi:MAG: hypothetical protein QXX38_00545 [Candidatus Aenigmatarchaeota archaeon]
MIFKIFGAILILFGFFLIFLFPEWKEFEYKPFTRLALLIGIFFILFGIYLLRR